MLMKHSGSNYCPNLRSQCNSIWLPLIIGVSKHNKNSSINLLVQQTVNKKIEHVDFLTLHENSAQHYFQGLTIAGTTPFLNIR